MIILRGRRAVCFLYVVRDYVMFYKGNIFSIKHLFIFLNHSLQAQILGRFISTCRLIYMHDNACSPYLLAISFYTLSTDGTMVFFDAFRLFNFHFRPFILQENRSALMFQNHRAPIFQLRASYRCFFQAGVRSIVYSFYFFLCLPISSLSGCCMLHDYRSVGCEFLCIEELCCFHTFFFAFPSALAFF